MRYRALLMALAVMTTALTVLAIPMLCNEGGMTTANPQFDSKSLANGMSKSMMDVNGDSEGEPLNNTAVTQWAATILAGSLALIALIVVLMVVSMFRRQSKEGGK